MKQKKYYSLILAAVLALSTVLTGCGSDGSSAKPADTSVSESPAPTVSPEASAVPAASASPQTAASFAPSSVSILHSDKFKVSDGKVTFTDATGSEVTLTIKPERVVTLSNNWHDLWYDCGGTAVGRVDEELSALRNEEAKAVKVIGNSSSVSLEAVLAEEPDLVILGSPSKDGQDMAAALKDAGVEYLLYDYENFEGFLETLELYTILTDRADLYEKWAAENIAKVDHVREICAEQTPAQIIMLLPHATSGIYALKNSGFLGSLLEDLNTVNVAFQDAGGEDKNFVISMEELLKLDPQFILSRGGSGDGTEATATAIYESNPLWFELTAVKEGRYHHLPSDLFLYKANVRYGEAYEYLAKILYPDAFTE
ncbi:ABC transporter substrate-binding protein [Diplocloster modestus]|uniref:ABC transporter substrate-binding protein n=1 Tax=Diplocloster modestus TaxID=2850322 RepID=A0ABS6KDI9_9FIRM|nr:ABC transporter substrate-binding protein [Diplocloster modestus]MBU9728580.1 ABC transporter substrate-binding protein [Diplocloster modestus]